MTYSKQTWTPNVTPVDAAHMSHIEDGIAAVEAEIPAVAYGTTLPASPVDGQEAVLVDSTTNPSYQWRFRYNASSTSAYKWEFVGGAAAVATVGTQETNTTTTTWVDLATVGPQLTVPRSGEYLVEVYVQAILGASIPDSAMFGVADNGAMTPVIYANIEGNRPNAQQTGSFGIRRTYTAGWVPRLRYFNYVSGTSFAGRTFKLTPVRVS